MFHWNNGWFFERLANGDVRLLKKETSHMDANIIYDIIIPSSEWISIISSVSRDNETSENYERAKTFHM